MHAQKLNMTLRNETQNQAITDTARGAKMEKRDTFLCNKHTQRAGTRAIMASSERCRNVYVFGLKVFVFASFWWFGRRNGLVSCAETRVRILKERVFIERAFDGSIAPFVGFSNVIAFRFFLFSLVG